MVATAKTKKRLDRAWAPVVREELRRFASLARGHRLRSRVQFATDCIVIPEGPFEGQHWRPHYQPFSYWVLHLMDTLGFRKFRASGCVQSGKTFTLNTINTLWHLFERKETTIYGVPDINETGADKWTEELEPVIAKSPFLNQFRPRRGRGSKGGTPTSIKFTNGATLRFMGAGGGDHRRSHYTAPVVLKTEVDRYDESRESSRETSPVEQMEARTESFGDRAFSYEECTVTTEQGRIWTELQRSTDTKLYVRCLSCRHYVYPTREDLVGIEEAADIEQAAAEAAFKCSHCGVLWNENDRLAMLSIDNMLPVHRGQTVALGTDGEALVEGPLPKTDTLGISWNAFHNRFWSIEKIARDEWRALFSDTPDDADLKRRQFAWTLPAEPDEFDLTPLSIAIVIKRTSSRAIRVVPPNTRWMSCGVDAKQSHLHFLVRAWTEDDKGVVEGAAIDIGSMEVETGRLGVREALLDALKRFRDDRILAEVYRDDEGQHYVPGWTLVDAGWQERIIWEFMLDCVEQGIHGFMPILGRGQSEPPGTGAYVHPEKLTEKVLWIGEQCHIRRSSKYEEMFAHAGATNPPAFVMANSDEWKSFVHYGYLTPAGQAGALTTFTGTTSEERRLLREYAKQTTSEKKVRKVVPRRGAVDVWTNESRRPNHLFDTDYYSCVAANLCGVPIAVKRRERPRQSVIAPQPLTMPDGRPYMAAATQGED